MVGDDDSGRRGTILCKNNPNPMAGPCLGCEVKTTVKRQGSKRYSRGKEGSSLERAGLEEELQIGRRPGGMIRTVIAVKSAESDAGPVGAQVAVAVEEEALEPWGVDWGPLSVGGGGVQWWEPWSVWLGHWRRCVVTRGQGRGVLRVEFPGFLSRYSSRKRKRKRKSFSVSMTFS